MATVGEIREWLEEFDDDLLVILSRDSEGNNYSPVSGYSDVVKYWPQSTWSGDIYEEDDEEEEPLPPDVVDAVILWPY
jgi:hypothetical protein